MPYAAGALGASGALGYGNTDNIGDDEVPASAGDVELGGQAMELVGAKPFMCALLDTGALRCWGEATDGRLGYGSIEFIGDDETPASAGGRATRRARAAGDREHGLVRAFPVRKRQVLGGATSTTRWASRAFCTP